jgi:hypothetical protein
VRLMRTLAKGARFTRAGGTAREQGQAHAASVTMRLHPEENTPCWNVSTLVRACLK